MKKQWVILIIFAILLTVFLTACTEKPDKQEEVQNSLPALETGNGEVILDSKGVETNTKEQPEEPLKTDSVVVTVPDINSTSEPFSDGQSVQDTDETEVGDLVIDLGEGSVVGIG